MASNNTESQVQQAAAPAITLSPAAVPEDQLSNTEKKIESEIEKLNIAQQGINKQKNNILQSNPPQGPSAEYGADMWRLFDVYSRAGQLLALGYFEDRLAATRAELEACKKEFEEIKNAADKSPQGAEVVKLKERLEAVDKRVEVLENISRKNTGEKDKDGQTVSGSYAVQGVGYLKDAPGAVFSKGMSLGGGGVTGVLLGGIATAIVTPLALAAAPLAAIGGAFIDMLDVAKTSVFGGLNTADNSALRSAELKKPDPKEPTAAPSSPAPGS